MKKAILSFLMFLSCVVLLVANNWCDNLKKGYTKTRIKLEYNKDNIQTQKWVETEDIKIPNNHPCMVLDIKDEDEFFVKKLAYISFIFFLYYVTEGKIITPFKKVSIIIELIKKIFTR